MKEKFVFLLKNLVFTQFHTMNFLIEKIIIFFNLKKKKKISRIIFLILSVSFIPKYFSFLMEKKSFFKHNLFSSWKKKITCFYTWFLSFSWKKKNSQNISLDTWKGRFMFVLNFVFFLLEFFCSSISHPNIFLVSQNERKNLVFFLFQTFLFSAWKKKSWKQNISFSYIWQMKIFFLWTIFIFTRFHLWFSYFAKFHILSFFIQKKKFLIIFGKR